MVSEEGSLRIRLCGEFGIDAPDLDLAPGVVPGRQGRLVLAYLICAQGRTVPRDELAELLWPERLPDSWTTSLSAVVSKLRRLLGATGLDAGRVLTSSTAGITLDLPEDVWVDWEVAHRALATAETAVAAGEPTAAIEAATEALELADRGFLADPCPWVDTQQDTALDVGVRSAIALGEAHLLAGSFARAVDAGRDAVARAPGREAGHRLLMRALAASGERAEALRAWERCRAEVIDELGVEPSAETEAVYLQLLDAGAPAAVASDAGLPSGVVTFLFTDIVGSSALWERDGAAMDRALERHDTLIGDVVAAHGGSLLKSRLEGDATVSVFARATSAVHATLDLADAILAEPWPEGVAPELRMAVHTGEAVERGGDYFGPALNRAARLRALARPGQILLSQAASEVVVDHLPEGLRLTGLGHRDLRGLSRGEHVYALAPADEVVPDRAAPLLASRPPLPALFGSGEPFVGRDRELARLTEAFAAVGSPGPRGVLIGGEPGVGKSRIAAEAAVHAHEAGAVVLTGRCDEELGAPLQPFAECLLQLAPCLDAGRLSDVQGLEELGRLVPRLADPMTLDAPRADPDGERYALFDGYARLLTAVAAEAPVVLILDDLHWAGKTTLLLLRHLLRHSGPSPLLVLGTYRDTELGRTHPLAATLADLREDGTAERLTLTGLEPDDVAAYLRAVGREDRDLGAELARVTAGNPFFLIETVRHVVESGGRWNPDDLPEGVRETTGRRLSRLSEPANELLHVAAVAGPVFSLELVEEICGRELVDEIAEACEAGLVQEDESRPGRFRFAHALVRQVLLGELVTIRRVRLHRAIAEQLEARPVYDPDVQPTELARHWFECAATGDAERAVTACRRAADRAAERLAYAEAAELYGMAAQAGSASSEDELAELLVARVEALLAAGDAGPARSALDDLEQVTGTSARWTAWHATLSGQLAVVADPERLTDIIAGLRDAATVLHDEDDGRGEARAHYVHALALERLGRIGAAEQTLDRALAAARACDDRRLVDVVLASAPGAALWGPSPVTRASGRCLDVVRVLRITGGAPSVEAVALRCQAVLEALRGRLDAARTMVAAARRTFEELGLAPHLLETDVAAGQIELVHAHPAEAEAHLRPALDGLRDRGLDGETARAAALLGRALLAQGRVDEAEAVAQEAATLAGADLRAGVVWRSILALVAAARDDRTEALRLAGEAVGLSSATDALLLEVDARMALAEVLRTVGDVDAATGETRRALELCERKGATALAELTAQRLADDDQPAADGSATAVRPDGHRPPVRENLATANARRNAAMVNAGDLAGLRELASTVTLYEFGELSAEQVGAYVSEVTEASAYTITVLATLGERQVLYHGDFATDDAQRPEPWGESWVETLTIEQIAGDGSQRAWVLPGTHVGQAVAVLYEQFAENEAHPGPEHDRAIAAAQAVTAWCATNEQVVIDDVLELDLDHVVLLADGDEFDLRFGSDGALEGVSRPDGRRHHVRENLATAAARRIEAMLDAGDLAGFIESAADTTTHVYGIGELTPEETREYLSGNPEAPRSTAITMVATLGERHLLCQGSHDLAELPEPWGEAWMENLMVFRVARDGDVEAVWLFPVSHVGQAVIALYERFAEDEAEPGPEQAGALAAARAIAAWSDANPDVIVDDVHELDLEYVVLVGHDGEQTREVVLRFDAWERFTRPFPARAFADAVRERYLAPATTAVTVVATRGWRVALAEATTGELVVQEIDSRGAHVRWAWFASDDVDGAYATLDDWFTEVHGSRAGRPLVDLDLYDHPDRAAFDAYNAPDLVVEDHRLAGHATCSSRDEFFALIAGMRRDLVDLRLRQRHVLACARGLLAVVDQMGSVAVDASADLTPFEGSIVAVEELDDGGRVVRVDLYGEDQLADAVARYDAVAAGDARSKRPPGWERFEPVHPRTTEELAESLAPDVRIEDHRTLVGLPADGIDDVLERFDQMQRDTSIEVSTELLASRGQRFELAEIQRRGTWGLSGDVEQSHLSLGERNDDGRMVRIAFFDVEDRARAFAALDEWYLAGRELTWPSMLTVPAYDVTALETRLAPDVALEDHRLVGVETVHGRAPVLELLDGLRRQLSSVTTSVLHALEHERAGLYLASESGAVTATWAGDLAPFEYLIVSLTEYDETGLVVRWHLYDETQLREALARYDDLAPVAAQPTGGPGWERFERMRPPDIDELAARLAPDVRIEDHRSLVGVPADGRDDVLDQLSKLQRDTSLRIWGELLATRGGRFALNEVHHRGTWGPSGEIEQSHLGLVEHDDDGRIVRMAFLDAEDRERAIATLDEWYLAGRELGWPSMLSTVQAYDSGRLEELNLAPDVVWEDHRLLGLGTRRGRDQVIDLIDGMRRAASSMAISTLHALEHERAGLYVASESGSVAATGPGDVAPFEYLVVSLTEHDDRGLVVAWHIYDEAQLPEALTRYDALAPQV